MTAWQLAGVWALCGVVLLDKWAVGEFGFSQPIVACPLLGWAMGVPEAGLALGAALQLVWVAALPLGKSRPLDYQGAGVGAIVGYKVLVLAVPGAGEGKLVFAALVVAVAGGVLGELLDSAHKRLNNRIFEAGVRAATPSGLVGAHLSGVLTSWMRGVVLAALLTGIASAAARLVPVLPAFSRAEVLGVTLAVGLGGAVRMFVNLRRVPLFAAGGAVGAALLMLVSR